MMTRYVVKRLCQAIPILIGVNLITFFLFFFVNSPDDIARIHLGQKYVSREQIEDWKKAHGYDVPLVYNPKKQGVSAVTDTIFFQKSLKLFIFDFGMSDAGRDIIQSIQERYLPSLQIALPSFILGLVVNIFLAFCLILFYGSRLDFFGAIFCLFLMSVSTLFFMIFGQFLMAKLLQWLPVSGYEEGWGVFRFLILPVSISVLTSIGAQTRWYRSLFLEEMAKDYVRTAVAKGLSPFIILLKHILPNAAIPILTGVVSVLPLLFMGSLLMESFFAIPGLGSYTIDAIREQDFAVVRAMVFLGTELYILGLLLTDISYVWVDKRIRLS